MTAAMHALRRERGERMFHEGTCGKGHMASQNAVQWLSHALFWLHCGSRNIGQDAVCIFGGNETAVTLFFQSFKEKNASLE